MPSIQTSSRLEVEFFTDQSDGLCERTGTDAESAFDDASFTADVTREVEDCCLALAEGPHHLKAPQRQEKP